MDSGISKLENAKLILKVYLLNTALTPLILFCAFLIIDGHFENLINYENAYNIYSIPWHEFGFFLEHSVIKAALSEEFLYRYPVIIAAWIFTLDYWRNKFRLTRYLLIAIGILLNAHWAYEHTQITNAINGKIISHTYYFIFLPVFFAGLTWLYLTIKIRPRWPWPSIICHMSANLSIYLFLKLLVIWKLTF